MIREYKIKVNGDTLSSSTDIAEVEMDFSLGGVCRIQRTVSGINATYSLAYNNCSLDNLSVALQSKNVNLVSCTLKPYFKGSIQSVSDGSIVSSSSIYIEEKTTTTFPYFATNVGNTATSNIAIGTLRRGNTEESSYATICDLRLGVDVVVSIAGQNYTLSDDFSFYSYLIPVFEQYNITSTTNRDFSFPYTSIERKITDSGSYSSLSKYLKVNGTLPRRAKANNTDLVTNYAQLAFNLKLEGNLWLSSEQTSGCTTISETLIKESVTSLKETLTLISNDFTLISCTVKPFLIADNAITVNFKSRTFTSLPYTSTVSLDSVNDITLGVSSYEVTNEICFELSITAKYIPTDETFTFTDTLYLGRKEINNFEGYTATRDNWLANIPVDLNTTIYYAPIVAQY